MELEWTDPALDDLEAIRDYIGRDSPHYARGFIERIFVAAEKLQDHPKHTLHGVQLRIPG